MRTTLHSARAPRRGFTLVELLVVIAIIAVLIGLLLPAVQSAREAARRGDCTSKLKQVALAVLNYESARGHFPPEGVGYGWCTSSAGGAGDTDILNMSGFVLLLPYMEETALHDRLDRRSAFANRTTGGCCSYAGNRNGTLAGSITANSPFVTQEIPALMCLSDPGKRTSTYNNGSVRGAATNYDFVANPGGLSSCNWWKTAAATSRYIFGEGSRTRIADVTDGTSHTLLMGETVREVRNGSNPAWAYRAWVQHGWRSPASTDAGTGSSPPVGSIAGRGSSARRIPSCGASSTRGRGRGACTPVAATSRWPTARCVLCART